RRRSRRWWSRRAARAGAPRTAGPPTSSRRRSAWSCPPRASWSWCWAGIDPPARVALAPPPPVDLPAMTEFIPPGTRYVDLPSPFAMKRGGTLAGGRIAYETWGRRNAAGDNSILILTGLSPDAHAAASEADPSPGWWEAME